MYAITFSVSACGRMKSGMLGCGFRSQTASARSVMPGESATIWKLGGLRISVSPRSTAWHSAHTFLA